MRVLSLDLKVLWPGKLSEDPSACPRAVAPDLCCLHKFPCLNYLYMGLLARRGRADNGSLNGTELSCGTSGGSKGWGSGARTLQWPLVVETGAMSHH